ncbi:MAG: methyltransferase, partial [Rhizobacter sp.]
MKSLVAALLATLALAAQAQPADALLDQALAGPQRSEANRARDAARHPRETLLFFGLQPGQTVIELAPGGGWYTEILAPVLRQRGTLIAAASPSDGSEYDQKSRRNFEDKLRTTPALYDKVQVGTLPKGKRFSDLNVPGGADLVLTFRNLHNWMSAGFASEALAALHRALKPGGILGVEDHRADPSKPVDERATNGYVNEDYAIRLIESAGFELLERSEINAN